MKKALIFIFFIMLQSNALADLATYKTTCTDIGYTPGTEKHGECVITLHKRGNKLKSSKPLKPNKFKYVKYDADKPLGDYQNECSDGTELTRQSFVNEMWCWRKAIELFGQSHFGSNWRSSNNSYSKLLKALDDFAAIAEKQVARGNVDVKKTANDLDKFKLSISANANALDAQNAQRSMNMMMLGLSIMQGGGYNYQSNSSSKINTPGYLENSYISGFNRICSYTDGISQTKKTIPSTQLCSLTK